MFIAASFTLHVPSYEKKCENNKGEHTKGIALYLGMNPCLLLYRIIYEINMICQKHNFRGWSNVIKYLSVLSCFPHGQCLLL